MVLDISMPESPSYEPGEYNTEDKLTTDLDQPQKKGLGKLHISHLLQMVLQDAQTRLFFKAQSVIQADVRYYSAKPEDLAYPEKLIGVLSVLRLKRASLKRYHAQRRENRPRVTRSKRSRPPASSYN